MILSNERIKAMEEMDKRIDELIQLENWRSFVSGKMAGGLEVLEVLDVEKERRIEVLAEALGLSKATATEVVNDFYEEKDLK